MAWENIGYIGVDAGLCWIGDPCYILHNEESNPDIGKDWNEFVNKYYEQDNDDVTHRAFGHSGFAVSTGFGDGSYPVYIKKTEDNRVAEVRIIFIQE